MEIRPITDDEIPLFRTALVSTFGGDVASDPNGDARFRALIPAGRAVAAFDGAQIVATSAAFDFTLTVPGGSVPMSGLTMVAVRPTHRRRGLLRELVRAYLEETRRRGQPVGGLWASEAPIYGRFGFGVAAECDDLSFLATGLEVAAGRELDDMAILDESAPEELAAVYDRARAERPGMLSRSPDWWRYRRFTERPELGKSGSPRRFAVARRAGAATGYVIYRQRASFSEGLPDGKVEIEELLATDARAEATLFRFVASVDLFPHVTWSNAPPDNLLPWLASDPRRIRRRRTDTLWLRLDDVAAALAARRYAADGVLVLDVTDPPSPEPLRCALSVEGGAATCAPDAGRADLRLDRAALAGLYLGAFSPPILARAGRIAGAPPALALAERMFATPVAPWCTEIF
jgi:predicted acetyltransferase